MDAADYAISNADDLFSPSLVFFEGLIAANLRRAVEIAGDPAKLRPHAKTHKCPEVAELALRMGIAKQKCATVAEAEMLAAVGVPDVLIAYPLVGPNLKRLAALIRTYPATSFAVLADHPLSVDALSAAVAAAGLTVRVLLDVDVGQRRTGIPLEEAGELYRKVAKSPGLKTDGIQLYDGHNHAPARADRERGVDEFLAPALRWRSEMERAGLPVPRLVCGGTPSFPVFAGREIPGLELSPGTFALHDANYGAKYEDLRGFAPAALVLTRVVSRPAGNRVTFDIGTKAVASDPPAGHRLKFLGFDDFTPVAHNEEHFVIETPQADRFKPGDWLLAIPAHVCPTVALHAHAEVVSEGRATKRWKIAARDRIITI